MADAEVQSRGVRKEQSGTVISRSGNKTIVVLVERRTRHPKYEKVIRTSKKFHAHDEENDAKIGDVVRIVEARPLSRLKRWRLIQIVGHQEEK